MTLSLDWSTVGIPLKFCADIEQELNEATSLLIREWADEKLCFPRWPNQETLS